MDKPEAVMGIDVGTSGAMAFVPATGSPVVIDWKAPEIMADALRSWRLSHSIRLVGVEKVMREKCLWFVGWNANNSSVRGAQANLDANCH